MELVEVSIEAPAGDMSRRRAPLLVYPHGMGTVVRCPTCELTLIIGGSSGMGLERSSA